MSRPEALLIATHGIDGGPGIAAVHARALATELAGIAVEAACLRGAPPVEEVAARLPKPVTVLPLLMAEGYILDLLRRRLSGIGGVEIAAPVGTHPGLAALALEVAEAAVLARGWPPADSVLLLVGHGTPRHPASGVAAQGLASVLREAGRFARVEAAFLEQPPFLADRLAALEHRRVVAVGLFVDAGPHGRDDVEAAIAAAPGPVVYTGPIGTQAGIRRLLLDRAGLGP